MEYLLFFGAIYFIWYLGKSKYGDNETTSQTEKSENQTIRKSVKQNLKYFVEGAIDTPAVISKGFEKAINGLEELNNQIALAKKALEIENSLYERFGYPFILENSFLRLLGCYERACKLKLPTKIPKVLGPELRQELVERSKRSKEIYEPDGKDECAINFLTSYQPWPFDLSPENLECYRRAIYDFGRRRQEYDFRKKYPSEICQSYFKKDLRLAKLFSEDKNDYFGTFLRYADEMGKGEEAAIKYDIQVRLLRYVTSGKNCLDSKDILCHYKAAGLTKKLQVVDEWFIKRIIDNVPKLEKWSFKYLGLLLEIGSYVDVESLNLRIKKEVEWIELVEKAELISLKRIKNKEKVSQSSESLSQRIEQPSFKLIKEFIEQNQVKALYHFTARENLDSIVKSGGLFSWKYLENHGIFYHGGGNNDSKALDKRKHLENYVRLSFCKDHPMRYHVQKRLQSDTVLLEIDPAILFEEGVLVSDINAADSDAQIQNALKGLKTIKYSATQRSYVKREDPDFKQHQAEILIPEVVPLKFIKNLNNYG